MNSTFCDSACLVCKEKDPRTQREEGDSIPGRSAAWGTWQQRWSLQGDLSTASSSNLHSPHMKIKGAGIGSSEAEADIPLESPFIILGGYQEWSSTKTHSCNKSCLLWPQELLLEYTWFAHKVGLWHMKRTIIVTNEMCHPYSSQDVRTGIDKYFLRELNA